MEHYKPLEIERWEVRGIDWAMEAMRLPMGSEGDSDLPLTSHCNVPLIGQKDRCLANKLVKAGPDYAKCMRIIHVWLKIHFQVGWGFEFETYRAGVECGSTSSSMHQELKGLSGELLADRKQADLPDKVYTRILTVSYQALRSMYLARKNHRHPDWQALCEWIKTLPYADALITPPTRAQETISRLREEVEALKLRIEELEAA